MLTDTQYTIFATRAVLPGRQPWRRGHLSVIGELRTITHSGNQRGCDHRPNTAKLLQPLCNRPALGDGIDLAIKFFHTMIHGFQTHPTDHSVIHGSGWSSHSRHPLTNPAPPLAGAPIVQVQPDYGPVWPLLQGAQLTRYDYGVPPVCLAAPPS